MNYRNILAFTLLVAVVGVISFLFQRPEKAVGTVQEVYSGSFGTSTYYSSVSSAATGGCILLKGATSTFAGPANGRTSGVLENIVFTGLGRGASSINFYDATSTNVNARTGNPATTTITLAEVFGGNSASTTVMELNLAFNTGLTMCVSGTPASSTVTWK